MTFSSSNPFNGPVPETVPLPQTPLTGVLVQIKFPEILSIAKAEYIASFQEAIRSQYPLYHPDQALVLQVGPDGTKRSQIPHWRFFDVNRQWRLSLTTNFVAIETRAYESRSDLTSRVETVAKALAETLHPGLMTRIGVRYVDRVFGEPLEKIEQLVRPEVLGAFTPALRGDIGRMMNEVVAANTDVGDLTSRWGIMPANSTHEPDLMPAINSQSWFLDIDVYQEFRQPEAYDPSDIQRRVMQLATRAYGFFRWVVSDEFLQTYGATS